MENRLDQRISNMPGSWAAPAAEVLDTVECVLIALRQFKATEDPLLIADLTRMILERHDAEEQRLRTEAGLD